MRGMFHELTSINEKFLDKIILTNIILLCKPFVLIDIRIYGLIHKQYDVYRRTYLYTNIKKKAFLNF